MMQQGNRASTWGLVVVLGVAAVLRFYGLDWGTDRLTGRFHAFHPDETNVVVNAAWVGRDLSRIRSPYGKAPMYLLRGAAAVYGPILGVDPFNLSDNRTARITYTVARGLSALFGTLTVLIAYLIGCRLGGPWTGLLGAWLLAASPGHIQQGHYYTVDGAFAFWVALALYLALRLPSGRAVDYVTCGAACGFAAGTRLVGVWLVVPVLFVHLYRTERVAFLRPDHGGLPYRRLALFALTSAAVGLACEPALLTEPVGFLTNNAVLSVKGSVQVVQGDRVEIWTLCDFATTRYLYQLTHLLWYGLGPWLEAAALLGLVLAVWLRRRAGLALLCWAIPYYLLIGGFHSKPIRYTTPLLPLLAVLGAWLCVVAACRLRHRWPRSFVFAMPTALVVAFTTARGLAAVRVYQEEDSRIRAERWVREHVPKGSAVLVERGGFPTSWMVSEGRYRPVVDDAAYYIVAEGNVPCGTQLDYLREKLNGVSWAVCIAENRMRQYLSVPDRYPVGCGFYRRLASGALGFQAAARFKVRPGLPGWEMDESWAEPTTTAFDHPEVIVFKKVGGRVAEELAAWRRAILQDPALPEAAVQRGVAAYHRADWDEAAEQFRAAVRVRPAFTLGYLMLREALLR